MGEAEEILFAISKGHFIETMPTPQRKAWTKVDSYPHVAVRQQCSTVAWWLALFQQLDFVSGLM